jgi:hypothetical protein
VVVISTVRFNNETGLIFRLEFIPVYHGDAHNKQRLSPSTALTVLAL